MAFPPFVEVTRTYNGKTWDDVDLTIHNTGQYGEDSERITLSDEDVDKLIICLNNLRKTTL